MPLKYHNQLNERPDQPCPCLQKFAARDFTAFRFVFSQTPDASDFNPPAIRDGAKQKDKCNRYALSFFMSLEEARAKYQSLAGRIDVRLKLGEYVGKIDLVSADGVSCAPNSEGHVDLHEYENIVFHTRMTECQPVLEQAGA